MGTLVAECRTVAIEIVPLCREVTPVYKHRDNDCTVHSGAISIATVLHSATDMLQRYSTSIGIAHVEPPHGRLDYFQKLTFNVNQFQKYPFFGARSCD